MKKLGLILLALCGFAAIAYAAPKLRWSVTTAGGAPWTASAPSTACNLTEGGTRTGAGGVRTVATGLNLAGCKQLYICASAESGQTLSGAGTLDGYFWDPDLAQWTRDKAGDFAITAASEREECFEAREVFAGYGCGYWKPTGVTGSGGTNLVVTATCTW